MKAHHLWAMDQDTEAVRVHVFRGYEPGSSTVSTWIEMPLGERVMEPVPMSMRPIASHGSKLYLKALAGHLHYPDSLRYNPGVVTHRTNPWNDDRDAIWTWDLDTFELEPFVFPEGLDLQPGSRLEKIFEDGTLLFWSPGEDQIASQLIIIEEGDWSTVQIHDPEYLSDPFQPIMVRTPVWNGRTFSAAKTGCVAYSHEEDSGTFATYWTPHYREPLRRLESPLLDANTVITAMSEQCEMALMTWDALYEDRKTLVYDPSADAITFVLPDNPIESIPHEYSGCYLPDQHRLMIRRIFADGSYLISPHSKWDERNSFTITDRFACHFFYKDGFPPIASHQFAYDIAIAQGLTVRDAEGIRSKMIYTGDVAWVNAGPNAMSLEGFIQAPITGWASRNRPWHPQHVWVNSVIVNEYPHNPRAYVD